MTTRPEEAATRSSRRVAADVSHQGLGLDLLPEVPVDVAPERARTTFGVLVCIDTGQSALREDTHQVEVSAELAREERVQVVQDDPPRQQVGVAAPELPRARARQEESESSGVRVEDRLDAVEKGRDPLHLVDEDGSGRRGRGEQLPLEPLRLRDEIAKGGEACQVEREVGGERAKERGLADLSRTEQEHVLPAAAEPRPEESFIHVGKISYVLPTIKKPWPERA